MARMILIGTGLVAMILSAAGLQSHDFHTKEANAGKKDLVFMHMPYNFGHPIEISFALPPHLIDTLLTGHQLSTGRRGFNGNDDGGIISGLTESGVRLFTAAVKIMKPDYEPWGHLNADLFKISKVTGCPLYFTPQKYWPKHVAARYFGTKTIFGVLRDPYERLVAQFRGNFDDYGGGMRKFRATCDVNSAIQAQMKAALNSTNRFGQNCAYLPQAEYFDGPYGIQLPVDNRWFLRSTNEILKAHGYTERVREGDIPHVDGCNNVWAGDLTAETKRLVREVYSRDFELICKHFGYCDNEANTCIKEVKQMCPEKLFRWDAKKAQYVSKA